MYESKMVKSVLACFTGLLLLASCGDVNGGSKDAGKEKELVDVSAIERNILLILKVMQNLFKLDTSKSDSPLKESLMVSFTQMLLTIDL